MDKIIRPFLDANVLFTAAYNPKGLAAMLIKNKNHLKLDLRTSRYAVDEARNNIQIKAWIQLESLDLMLNKIRIFDSAMTQDLSSLDLPLDDVPIFQGAILSNSTHLLTGDLKAFSKWMNAPEKTCGIIIQTIRQFIDTHISL